ncbi:MAG: DUF6783 domain-containing protein [Ruminococcus sp.]
MFAKSPAKWGVQIAESLSQTCSGNRNFYFGSLFAKSGKQFGK